MKNIFFLFLFGISTSCHLLLAQQDDQTTDSMDSLSCDLMMNPGELENVEGIIFKNFTPPEKKRSGTISDDSPSTSVTSAGSIVSTSSTVASTSSFREDSNQCSEDEIVNIYQNCLTRIDEIRQNSSNVDQEIQNEWEAAHEMATEEEAEYKSALEKAKTEASEAKRVCDTMSSTVYGVEYLQAAHHDWQTKNCEALLAEARLKRAQAILKAIKFRNTGQRASAVAKLNEALVKEKGAVIQAKETAKEIASQLKNKTLFNNLPSSSSATSNRLPEPKISIGKKTGDDQQGNYSSIPLTSSQTSTQSSLTSSSSRTPSFGADLPVVRAFAVESYNSTSIPANSQLSSQKKNSSLVQNWETSEDFETNFLIQQQEAKVQAEEIGKLATTAKERAGKADASEQDLQRANEYAIKAKEAYHQLSECYKKYQQDAAHYYEGNNLYMKQSQHNIDWERAKSLEKHWQSQTAPRKLT